LHSVPNAHGIEVQRLQPTYIGSRFERIATLPGDATSFVDQQPLNGEPTAYRVRALFNDGASDYSNHVHVTAPANPVVLESQPFDQPPRDWRDEFRPQKTPEVDADVIPDPANPANRVLHVRARRPAGVKEFLARPRWIASQQLFDALNTSVSRPRGSRPDLYRVQFKLRLLQAQVSPGSEVSVQVDPEYNLFATPGRRQDFIALAQAKNATAGAPVAIAFDFAAFPNGAGLQNYRAEVPRTALVVFPIDLRGDGDSVEFLIDDLTVSRLDPPP
jgi:hypothetical protein